MLSGEDLVDSSGMKSEGRIDSSDAAVGEPILFYLT
jgi:hypothetical protein